MIGVYVSVPIACFRKGLAREYLETEPLPPPSTCYGFLLSLVGECDRTRHIGARVTAALMGNTQVSVVLRTVWRVKEQNYYVEPTGRLHIVSEQTKRRKKFETWVSQQGWPKPSYEFGLGCGSNTRPDYQQLLTGDGLGPDRFLQLVLWLDSAGERNDDTLEDRVRTALDPERRHRIRRFGGLSLGESTHLVDEVCPFPPDPQRTGRVFLLKEDGRMTLPVWVDHVGSADTRYVTGELVEQPLTPPPSEKVPVIGPEA